MPERDAGISPRSIQTRHRGRGSQVWIYLGKTLRMFIYQNDWKVLPMAALIAGLVGFVIRRKMFLNMEGTVMGALAMACVCIWNGCFNSIQLICRERDVIKREHRSGMHISSYVFSLMVYQAAICIMQTVITLYITKMAGVKYPDEGLFTRWMIVDMGISMVLITYASDMLSLWVSALARSSTTAMTIMPFILIFQLVFSGGMLSLPDWALKITNYTISGAGLRAISAQADTNNRPFVTISNMLDKMRDKDIEVELTLDKILGLADMIENEDAKKAVEDLRKNPLLEEYADEAVPLTFTVGQLMDVAGEKNIKAYLEDNASAASYRPEYENTKENIGRYWRDLILFALLFALLATITLEFIDKDKR